MRSPVDAAFRDQAARYRLHLFCEECAYFEPETRACSEGYPNAEHRRVDLALVGEVVFCKSFEAL
ncbi:MAG: hypothetical protein RJA70_1705 [Pseudomonadota bacterium]|jgi:hypothetical protein